MVMLSTNIVAGVSHPAHTGENGGSNFFEQQVKGEGFNDLVRAALDHFPTLAIWAMVSWVSAGWLRYCQNRLKWRFCLIFLKMDFVGIGLVVRSRI